MKNKLPAIICLVLLTLCVPVFPYVSVGQEVQQEQRRRMQQIQQQTKEVWERARREAEEAWRRAHRKSQEVQNNTYEKIKEVNKRVKEIVQQWVRKARQHYQDLRRRGLQVSPDAWRKSQQQIQEEQRKARQEVHELMKSSQQKRQELWMAAQQKRHEIWTRTQQEIDQLWEVDREIQVVKSMLFALVPGTQFISAAEAIGGLLQIGPDVLVNKWNLMFELGSRGWEDPISIDKAWASKYKPQMIALHVALKRLQEELELSSTKVTPENFPKYQELIDRAYTMWPR